MQRVLDNIYCLFDPTSGDLIILNRYNTEEARDQVQSWRVCEFSAAIYTLGPFAKVGARNLPLQLPYVHVRVYLHIGTRVHEQHGSTRVFIMHAIFNWIRWSRNSQLAAVNRFFVICDLLKFLIRVVIHGVHWTIPSVDFKRLNVTNVDNKL